MGDTPAVNVNAILSGNVAVATLPMMFSTPPQGEATQLSIVPHRELRADLLWGDSGHGKDTNLWFGVYHVAKRLKKKSLLLTGESLGTGMQMAEKLGIVDVVSLAGCDKPLDLVAAILKGGKWPKKTQDGKLDLKSRECIINPEEIGLLAVNSMTSISKLFGLAMQIEGAVRLPMSPKKENYNVIINGVTYSGSAPTHVGFIQDKMYDYVVASTYLPVDKVLWTARQQLGAIGEKTDKDGNILKTGFPIFGPSIAGKAATSVITSWFGGAYHLDKVPVTGVKDDRKDALPTNADKMQFQQYEYRLYLEKHIHPDFGVPFDVKNRLPAIINADLLKENGPTKGKPYIVCSETRDGKGWKHTGLNTVWELEEKHVAQAMVDAQEDLKELLDKFRKDRE